MRSICIVLTALAILFCGDTLGHQNVNVIEREEILEPNGRYTVQWTAFPDKKTVQFTVTAKTTGYVGFGLSPLGGMTGADIVIGGVHPNGTAYFSDRHGVGNMLPELDDEENWVLIEASENATHTVLRFQRDLDTCDPQDVAIGNGTINYIWSMGSSDTISYHGTNRGIYAVNVLDPPMPPFDASKYESWNMMVDMVMPSDTTTYWCTVHKSPPMPSKRHIIAFRSVLESAEALAHTHHMIVHSCHPPAGSSAEETFESYIGTEGGECYSSPEHLVPKEHCQSYLYVWAIGGKMVIYPEHVGFPVGDNGEANYYMLEMHYNNPNALSDVKYSAGLEIYYTPELRSFDAGTLTVGHQTTWTITIPPSSTNYMIVGHCSPACTNKIPAEGISVFNIGLHSHLSGRKLKIRHFRDNQELPWMASDLNYNFDYQQNRPLIEEIKILPGDQLTYECIYDSMWKNGSSVIGGLSTTEEMCNTFLWYYPKIPLEKCTSTFPPATLMAGLGISSMTDGRDPTVLSPPSMAGKKYTEVLDTMIPWTEANRAKIQETLRFGRHNNHCRLIGEPEFQTNADSDILVTYPDFENEYQPPNQCLDE